MFPTPKTEWGLSQALIGAGVAGFLSGVAIMEFLDDRDKRLKETLLEQIENTFKQPQVDKNELEGAIHELLNEYLKNHKDLENTNS